MLLASTSCFSRRLNGLLNVDPRATRGPWNLSLRRGTLELSGHRCANELTHRPGATDPALRRYGHFQVGFDAVSCWARAVQGETGGILAVALAAWFCHSALSAGRYAPLD